MWLKFLTDDNLQLVVNRPMSDLSNAVTTMEIGFFSGQCGIQIRIWSNLKKEMVIRRLGLSVHHVQTWHCLS